MNNWKILIVTNNKIISEYYRNDQFFGKQNWSFFNVSKERMTSSDEFDVINACDIEGYEFLGKYWAESEVIYNIGKLDLFTDYDFLGIIHWDFNLYSPKYDTYRITENINNIIQKYEWVSFFPASVSNITGYYDVLMDERKPNCLFVRNSGLHDPKSCNSFILEKIGNIDQNPNLPISLCCSFLTKRSIMIELSEIIAEIKNEGILDRYDTERRHRYPGQFMERLVALYSTKYKQFGFQLDHRFTGGRELNSKDPNGENY